MAKGSLSEMSLELKCRLLFGGGILLLIASSFYWYGRQMEGMVYEENANKGRLLGGPIVVKHHWNMWLKTKTGTLPSDGTVQTQPTGSAGATTQVQATTRPARVRTGIAGAGATPAAPTGSASSPGPSTAAAGSTTQPMQPSAAMKEPGAFNVVMEELYSQLAPEEVRAYTWRFLVPGSKNPNLQPADAFEREWLDGLEFGTADAGRVVPGKRLYQFLSPVRARQSCLPCHDTAKKDQLLAVLSVRFPLHKTDRAIHINRAILISTALVTAVLAMLGSYAIVRYVIVEPVTHLKEVSERVSAGDANVRADIHTGDEFEELSLAFNRMVRGLEASRDQFRRLNESLDSRVDELAQANLALFESNRLKSEFLATVSHELRTPLNSILGFSELLADSAREQDEKKRRYIENIQKSGRMLLGMINDILDLAKIESGKMDVYAQEFSLHDVVEGLSALCRPLAEKKKLDLHTRVAPDLPVLATDQGKLRQILHNLLSNAIKFTPEGGRITLDARSDNGQLVVSVADTGVGISEEDCEHVFEKFRQSGTALTREQGGSGLGLSIVRELCELLGGTVTVDSALGKGSVFTVRLPVQLAGDGRREVRVTHGMVDMTKARRVPPRPEATDHGA